MNIYDIAKEAGVSISTVSKYLNNKTIRPELKTRIEEVVAKYDYVPSAIAQGLVSKSMKLVAVMVVDIQISHYAAAAYAADKTLSALGYRVIICNTLGDEENSIKYLDSLLKINVDGIIFVGSIFNFLNKYEKVLEKLNNIPIISNNGHINTKNSYSIYVDDRQGVYDATKYLINKGRKKIIYFQYLSTTSSNLKLQGYKDALKEANLEPIVFHTDELMSGGFELVKQLNQSKVEVDAIMCGEDIIALGAISDLSAQGYKIGKDIDIIGFNASLFTNLANPKMTSVNNKIEETSVRSAEMLLDIIDGKEVHDEILPCSLVIKESA